MGHPTVALAYILLLILRQLLVCRLPHLACL